MKIAPRVTRIAVPAAATVALLGGGVALAADTTAPTSASYAACLSTVGHALYNVTVNGTPRKCLGHDQTITWNQTGPAGPKGDTGATGAPGQAGAAGKDGSSVLNGSGAPADSVGQDGDFYIDTAISTLYGPRTNGAWPTPGTSLVGPQGKQGTPGTPGTSGGQPFSVVGTPGTMGDKYLSGGPADIEAWCSGSDPELALYPQYGPAMVIKGFITTSTGSGAEFHSGNDTEPLTTGPVNFQGNTSFEQTGGMTTGTLLVGVGSSISTVTFAMSGGSASCVVTAQVTPSS